MTASNVKPLSFNDGKPLASISLDLDNQWSYMKIHGDAGWVKYPSYLDVFVPYALDILDRFNLKITFFVVGKDASFEQHADVLSLVTARGHEVGNHSFNHDPWLPSYSKDGIKREILETEEHLLRVTGQRTVGFRGPGFGWSKALFDLLFEYGYLYDSTIQPTFLGPVARAYYFRGPNLTPEEKSKLNEVLGGFGEGMRSVKAYYWLFPSKNKLLEIPITTIPIVKMPFHMSYLLFLSRFSVSLMLLYLRVAITLCQLTQTEPNFVLHPTDFLSGEQVPAMNFFPGMDLSKQRKSELFAKVIGVLSKHYRLVKMSTHANAYLENNSLKSFHV
jgi:hypothetical protein